MAQIQITDLLAFRFDLVMVVREYIVSEVKKLYPDNELHGSQMEMLCYLVERKNMEVYNKPLFFDIYNVWQFLVNSSLRTNNWEAFPDMGNSNLCAEVKSIVDSVLDAYKGDLSVVRLLDTVSSLPEFEDSGNPEELLTYKEVMTAMGKTADEIVVAAQAFANVLADDILAEVVKD